MPNLRASIAMTDDEVAEFVRSSRSATLATIGKDGRPHLASMWFALLDGEIVMHSKAKSQKVVNIRRDPRVTVLLEAGTVYAELRGVAFDATAELVADDDAAAGRLMLVGALVAQRYRGEDDAAPAEQELAQQMRNRVAIVVHVDRTRSWDHRKLSGSGPVS